MNDHDDGIIQACVSTCGKFRRFKCALRTVSGLGRYPNRQDQPSCGEFVYSGEGGSGMPRCQLLFLAPGRHNLKEGCVIEDLISIFEGDWR